MNSGEPTPPNGITYIERESAKGNKSQKITDKYHDGRGKQWQILTI